MNFNSLDFDNFIILCAYWTDHSIFNLAGQNTFEQETQNAELRLQEFASAGTTSL